jgi:hypothetical protein
MPADFTGTFQDVYTVRMEPSEDFQLQWIQGAGSLVKLSSVLRDHASIKRALANPESGGAILALHMRWEDIRRIYSAIEELAEQMDLPLPTKDKHQA